MHTIIYQVFLCNTNNLHTVIWHQVFLSNTNNLPIVKWYQVFVSNTNNLYTIVRFQVFLSRNYFLFNDRICLHTVIWFQITNNNPQWTIIISNNDS